MRLHACGKEPWTVAAIESMHPGEVLWDIGACVGSYTLIAAARKQTVVAFEPVSENYATLCRNLALNMILDEVFVLPIGLGPTTGLAWLHRSDMRSGAASHVMTDDPRKVTFHKQLVPILTGDQVIDLFKVPVPHVVKLDVDGTEPSVLMGMATILTGEQLRTLVVEMHTEWDGALTTWLAERGWGIAEKYEQRGPTYYAKFGRSAVIALSPQSEVLAVA